MLRSIASATIASDDGSLTSIALLSGLGMLISLLMLNCGLDLDAGIF
jgi:hypothetical protein